MNIISFSWSLPPLLAGDKWETTRPWAAWYANLFQVPRLCHAYNCSQRHGGVSAAWVLVSDPHPLAKWDAERIDQATYDREGFGWWAQHPEIAGAWGIQPEDTAFAVFEEWRRRCCELGLYTVRVKVEKAFYAPDNPILIPKRAAGAKPIWRR